MIEDHKDKAAETAKLSATDLVKAMESFAQLSRTLGQSAHLNAEQFKAVDTAIGALRDSVVAVESLQLALISMAVEQKTLDRTATEHFLRRLISTCDTSTSMGRRQVELYGAVLRIINPLSKTSMPRWSLRRFFRKLFR
jgi:hypothetical protein